MTRLFEQELRPLGITLQQLEILSTLTIVDRPIRPAELADLVAVERSTMSRNLSVMHDRGWVSTADISPTGRMMTVTITTAGLEQFARTRPAWHNAQQQVNAALGTDSRDVLDTWLVGLSRLR